MRGESVSVSQAPAAPVGGDAAILIERVPDGVVIARPDGVIVSANSCVLALFGYESRELVGQPVEVLMPDRLRGKHVGHREQFREAPAVRPMGVTTGLIARRKDGSEFPVDIMLSPMMEEPGAPILVVIRDVSERESAIRELKYRTYHDPLTGLRNRSSFEQDVTRRLEAASGANQTFSIALIDLDHFKEVNTLGPSAGDALLKLASRRIEEVAGADASIYRVGGDEFAVVIGSGSSQHSAAGIVDRTLRALHLPFSVGKETIPIGASAGLVTAPIDGSSVDELLAHADLALYKAKSTGRGRYRIYSPELRTSAHHRRQLDLELRAALERSEFRLYYQPQINLRDGSILGAEALLRWHHPIRGVLEPAAFIRELANSAMANAVGDWVLATACRQVAGWRAGGRHPVLVAVNLFGRQFTDRDLVGRIDATLAQNGLPPEALELEFTEDISLEANRQGMENLRALRRRGISLVLDDFGTGYASISTIVSVPINKVKIDRQFISNLDTDPDNAAVVKAIASLSEAFRLDVVAEGIERIEEATLLRDLRPDIIGQGFLFGPALPAGPFDRLLRASSRGGSLTDFGGRIGGDGQPRRPHRESHGDLSPPRQLTA